MISLLDLPTEMVANIVSCLDDYRAIVLASRDLHAITLPMMYKNIDLVSPRDGTGGQLRLSLLLRTLLSCPQLGGLTRVCTIGRANHVLYIQTSVETSPRVQVSPEEIFLKSLHEAGNDSHTILSPSFPKLEPPRQCSYSGELLELLRLLSRLKTVRFSDGSAAKETIASSAAGLLSCGIPSSFRSIENMVLRYRDQSSESRNYDGEHLLHLLSLPSLTRLEIRRLVGGSTNNNEKPFTVRVEHTSSVRTLIFRYCDIQPRSLASLISVPRNLFTFVYEMRPAASPISRIGLIDWVSLNNAFVRHSESLTKIDVTNLSLNDDSHSTGGTMETLHSFCNLQHVRLPVEALFIHAEGQRSAQTLVQLLPPSLETFKLRFSTSWSLQQFMDQTRYPSYWHSEQVNFPKLERWVISRNNFHVSRYSLGIDVYEAFRDVGIVIQPPLGNYCISSVHIKRRKAEVTIHPSP